MPINLADLPLKYQAQAMAQIKQQKGGATAQKPKRKLPSAPKQASPSQGPKYRNNPTERVAKSGKVIRFASQKEAKRYDTLMLRLYAGEIQDLRLQTDFTLQEGYTDAEGNRIQAIKYQADFTYWERIKEPNSTPIPNPNFDRDGWRYVVEDVKCAPTRTQKYLIKKKMMKEKLGIDITEI